MSRAKYFFVLWLGLLIALVDVRAQIPFTELLIDKDAHGDVKAIADLDNDGIKDLILAGASLAWYREEDGKYVKYKITDPEVEFTTDGYTGDVDNDGDIDLILADGKGAGNVMWYENPLPEKSPMEGDNWTNHIIGTHGNWMHNAAVGDLNMDRHLDVISSGHGITRLFLNGGKGRWTEINFSEYGGGAVDTYDMDGDGDWDMVTTKGWIECPVEEAFVAGNWKFHQVDGLGETIAAGDLDNDGKADILSADSAHVRGQLHWLVNEGTVSDPAWKKKQIDPEVGAHKLKIADFNRDGHADILYGPASTIIFFQPGSSGAEWTTKTLVNQYTTNAMDLADMDKDGDLDIITGEHRGKKRLILWQNNGAGNFRSFLIDQGKENHDGAKVVDLDNDGDLDIGGIGYDTFPFIHVWWNDAIVK